MESVLDSVRSWRDLTAGLLPRVASAAQLEAKRLAVAQSSQVRKNERCAAGAAAAAALLRRAASPPAVAALLWLLCHASCASCAVVHLL